MCKLISRGAVLALMLLFMGFMTGTVSAQEAEELDVDALIQQFLPEGVTIETATDEQLVAAVAQACSAYPAAAGQIVFYAAQARPDLTADIVNTAVAAAPDQAEAIVTAAIEAAPAAALPAVGIEVPVAFIAPPALPEAADSPPARDDSPASPVNP